MLLSQRKPPPLGKTGSCMLCCTVSANGAWLAVCTESLMFTSTKTEQLGWLVLIFFFCVTWQKGKKPHLFSAALLQPVLHAEWLLLQSQSLGHPYSSKPPARKHVHVFLTLNLTGFIYISRDFNEKIKSLQHFRGKRAFTKGTLHIFLILFFCAVFTFACPIWKSSLLL